VNCFVKHVVLFVCHKAVVFRWAVELRIALQKVMMTLHNIELHRHFV